MLDKVLSCKRLRFMGVIVISLMMTLVFTGCAKIEDETVSKEIYVYAGSASKPATEEATLLFEKKTGIKVNLIFGGSGSVLSQMELNKKGDLYFPGSSDFMAKAVKKDLVFSDTEQKIVYLVNAINVQKGNPKNIQTLKDLLKPGVKVAIANPETVCVGLYATEILDKNLTPDEMKQFKSNLINYTESCEKTATAISLNTVDAVIGWSVFQYWNPERIETIPLDKSLIQRIGYIPIAISKYTENRDAAQSYIDFLVSDEGKEVFKKYHYFASEEEAEAYIGSPKAVGGEFELSNDWIQ